MDARRNSFSRSRELTLQAIEFELQALETTTLGFDYELHLYARIGGMLCLARSACLILEAEKLAFEARLKVAGAVRIAYSGR